ncbi:hypothetical protein predicted by Glimmer/Critica [Sorangium cellulosum So ce56]|uniref:Uncharacterized protein n=1 Tax=Sorangium cellulosum (strain So ce56) TaxID=448385 RepID=A9G200_SORC5|nr:hypothetical protein predicted by Glimmer/Critica [Sorangium cellulosum So ce56]
MTSERQGRGGGALSAAGAPGTQRGRLRPVERRAAARRGHRARAKPAATSRRCRQEFANRGGQA